MPEMPEVITVVRQLEQIVLNKTITKVEVFLDKLLKNSTIQQFELFVIGEKITSMSNVGKFILFELTNDKYIISHLRMTGKYATYHKMRPRMPHDYVVFTFSDNSTLYYNDARQFGTFHIKTKTELFTTEPLHKLGQIPAQTDPHWFFNKLAKKQVPIKSALLDQNLVLGIGNIYANEVLWELKIHPLTPCNQIASFETAEQLLTVAQAIMDKATEEGGSSIQSYASLNGKKGNYQNFLKVHTRVNLPCYRCQNPIEKIYVQNRGTYFCSNCQKFK
ncbi:DNA-formamidopyrimidine glycosylase [Mycoplasmopsis columbinasalis]|uniref:DNA-formamidopyrimidine glycosylase n=1 Tax=Mycoplasmopsis columbinasalis TaxID=114880 RepID=A0A449B9K8_9BACT|nr:DNA-formamidopyrimidine glycosylase [Mycoplasmopsis columbinasalis]VEU77857.1 DNA-formamidopyrimidine glycosylase [Mycoplasmopsis columbinasalis]